jgi:hypothetical protein
LQWLSGSLVTLVAVEVQKQMEQHEGIDCIGSKKIYNPKKNVS